MIEQIENLSVPGKSESFLILAKHYHNVLTFHIDSFNLAMYLLVNEIWSNKRKISLIKIVL